MRAETKGWDISIQMLLHKTFLSVLCVMHVMCVMAFVVEINASELTLCIITYGFASVLHALWVLQT